MKKKTPRRVLLDQWHFDIYIRPNNTLSREQRRVINTLMNSYLELVKSRIVSDLENRIAVVVSR